MAKFVKTTYLLTATGMQYALLKLLAKKEKPTEAEKTQN